MISLVNLIAILTPVLALLGALLGGSLAQITGGRVAERREDRRLLREARVALERWAATRNGPLIESYPGFSTEDLLPMRKHSFEVFFSRHFEATLEAKAALGAIRMFDERIGRVLDEDSWDLPNDKVNELRDAISLAERRTTLTGLGFWWSQNRISRSKKPANR